MATKKILNLAYFNCPFEKDGYLNTELWDPLTEIEPGFLCWYCLVFNGKPRGMKNHVFVLVNKVFKCNSDEERSSTQEKL